MDTNSNKRIFFKIKKSLNFSFFPYLLYKDKYELLLFNCYSGKNYKDFFYDKGKKIFFYTLNTEQGKLIFIENDIKIINKKDYINCLKQEKYNNIFILKNKIPLFDIFPYFNNPSFYVDLIEKKKKFKILKKIKLNNEVLLLCKLLKKENILEEEFIIKEEDIIIYKEKNEL